MEETAELDLLAERYLDLWERQLAALLDDPARRAGLGAAARALVESNRGAKGRTLQVIRDLMPPEASEAPTPVVRPFRLVQ